MIECAGSKARWKARSERSSSHHRMQQASSFRPGVSKNDSPISEVIFPRYQHAGPLHQHEHRTVSLPVLILFLFRYQVPSALSFLRVLLLIGSAGGERTGGPFSPPSPLAFKPPPPPPLPPPPPPLLCHRDHLLLVDLTRSN